MSAAERSGLAIITDLYNLTCSMVQRLSEPDYLMQCVDERQALMDEYDASRAKRANDPDIDEIKQLVKKILELDVKINDAMNTHKNEARNKVTELQNRQKAMTYTAGNISASGTYMNYSK